MKCFDFVAFENKNMQEKCIEHGKEGVEREKEEKIPCNSSNKCKKKIVYNSNTTHQLCIPTLDFIRDATLIFFLIFNLNHGLPLPMSQKHVFITMVFLF